jgi:hypothetical protein
LPGGQNEIVAASERLRVRPTPASSPSLGDWPSVRAPSRHAHVSPNPRADLVLATSGLTLERSILALHHAAGNAAVGIAIQRQAAPARAPSRRGRPRRGPRGLVLGSDGDILNFTTYLEIATTTEALSSGRFDSGVAFSSPRLARAWERFTWLVSVVANPRRRSEIPEASRIWDQIRPTVDAVVARARGQGFDVATAVAGITRMERQLHRIEASELARAGERKASLASPDAGLYVDQDAQLKQGFTMLSGLIKEGEGIIQWNDRHLGRALSGPQVATMNDARVRVVNLGRTAISWLALWEDYQTIGDRVEAAKSRGMLDKAATIAQFVDRATTVTVESFNAFVNLYKDVASRTATQLAKVGSGFMDDAVAEARKVRWRTHAEAVGVLRLGVGIAGALQIGSNLLGLIRAIRDDDVRGGVGAAHGLAQGSITLGGAVLKASAGATTMLSGSVAVVWITIEAIFDIAEISAWGRRQEAIAEIARPLRVAASLIPWGKRMAGVADALLESDSDDPGHRAAIEERLIQYGTEPFNTVLRGMLGVQTWIGRRPELEPVMGPQAMAALKQLDVMQYRGPSDPVSPWDIQTLSDLCGPIFAGLQRVGLWAVSKYGDRRETKDAKARLRALEAGEAVPPP